MTRQTYLENIWKPYPSAQSSWLDIAEFLTSEKKSATTSAVVAGRLVHYSVAGTNGKAQLELASGGAAIPLYLPEAEKKIEWLEPQRVACDFQISFLQPGDLLAAQVKNDSKGDWPKGNWIVEKILLLAPNRSEILDRGPMNSGGQFDVERSKLWARFLGFTRDFFTRRNFIEAQTPTLVASPGTEPFLEPFKTSWQFGSLKRDYYLPTSPEFHLKKMLARGWSKIFELKTCFRNGEISETHQPEFLMLEWYRAYSNLDAIADDVDAMLTELAMSFQISIPKLKRVHMKDLFASAFSGFQLRPETSLVELKNLAKQFAVDHADDDTWDDLFFRLFLEKIESGLGHDGPLLVRGYPPSQAALSRIADDGFADRFEVYWRGLELANAFHELNDPAENLKRFEDDVRKKTMLGKEPVPIDDELVQLIESGLPPSGGIALGLDRLFMAAFGFTEISQVRAFPVRAQY